MSAESFSHCFVSDLLLFRAGDCTKANEELQKLRDVAEAREAATEEKLRLELQARRRMIRKSYCYVFSVIFFGLD